MSKKDREDSDLKKKFKEGEYSNELKSELDELHKFKWSHILWPILSIIFIIGTLLFVYKNYIIKDTNSVIDRKSPAEKIKSKPELKPEEPVVAPVEAPKPEVSVPAPVPATPTTEDYVIKDGDTLGAIAEARGLSSADIIAANPGLVAESIQIGQTIKIPKK